MQVLHATTGHQRHDARIYHRQCVLIAERIDITLVVADGFGNESSAGVNIIDVGASADGRFRRLLKIAKFFLDLPKGRDTIVHLHDPELFLLTPILSLRKIAVVLDIHEDYASQIITRKSKYRFFNNYVLGACYRTGGYIFSVFTVVPQVFLKEESILVGNYLSRSSRNTIAQMGRTSTSSCVRRFYHQRSRPSESFRAGEETV